MKANLFCFRPLLAAMVAVVAFAGTAAIAEPVVTAQLDRSLIALGDSARLTITASGDSADNFSPPVVPGLDFVSVGQSSQFQSINGVSSSTTSITYQVTPQRAGNFTIPALSAGAQPLVLNVQSGNGGRSTTTGINSGASSMPPPAMSGSSETDPHTTADGAAFARLVLPKHELYVGETVPVEIQVGLRPGMVAQLDGLPTLNGDAFTLNKLSSKPDETQEVVGDMPYTVLTWHSVLSAVKPGDFPLTVETPLTVQIRTQQRAQLPEGMLGGSMLNDPFFQSFFGGGTTQKQITVASDPDTFKVLELPAAGRPAGFGGAVGRFAVSSELSAAASTAGDPLTLRLKVTGSGNFDRVNSPMLGQLDGWKTYPPTAKFVPADSAGYSGEKDFEQAVIPMHPGQQTVPALALSYFNPDTRRYETKTSAPLRVEVAPTSAGNVIATAASAAGTMPASETPHDGLRPDHVEAGGIVATLRPLYFQPWFVGTQSALILSFAGGLVFLRRRENRVQDKNGARRREASAAIGQCLARMDAASAASDPLRFFQEARAALQQKLAMSWQVTPASITIAEIDARLNGNGAEIRRVFALADQAAYSQELLSATDFQQWKETTRNQLKHMEEL